MKHESISRGTVPPKSREPGRPRGPRRRRRLPLLRWGGELVILLGVLFYFDLRSSSRRPPFVPSPIRPAHLLPPGPSVQVLGGAARPLRNLHEVRTARLANLEGLAPGSRAAQAAQEGFALHHGLPVEVVNSIGMHFRLVPPGTFFMGSPETEPGRWDGELRHVVLVPRPFYMGVTEVTQAQWQRVFPGRPNPSHFKGTDRPVEEITWYDAVRFTRTLCRMEGLPRGTYRLPTEAQWEYACRAGTDTAYCFGNTPERLGDYADFAGNNDFATNRVAQRRSNAYGLYDMHGNVWEWCLDLFRPYPDWHGEVGNTSRWRAVRGGNWHDSAVNCRSANRCRLPPASHGNLLGFRVIRVIPAEDMEKHPPSPSRSEFPVHAERKRVQVKESGNPR